MRLSLTAILACLLLLLSACGQPTTEAGRSLHPIHYTFDLAGPAQADTALQATWGRILARFTEDTQVYALLPDPAQPQMLPGLVATLRSQGSSCRLLVAPEAWVGDSTGGRDSLVQWNRTGLLTCTNVSSVPPPFPLRHGAIWAIQGLRPTLQDDGATSLLFADMAPDSTPQVQALLAIHGDPGLLHAFVTYWEGLGTLPGAGRTTQTKTFTDVYEHLLHYDDIDTRATAGDPIQDLLTSLDSGLVQLSRPARVRVLAPTGMSLPLQERLADLEGIHDLDLLVLWGQADSLETANAQALFRRDLRILPVQAGTPLLLVDGPFTQPAQSLPDRKRVLVLAQFDFWHPRDSSRSGILFQLANEVLFNRAHQQWQSLWEM